MKIVDIENTNKGMYNEIIAMRKRLANLQRPMSKKDRRAFRGFLNTVEDYLLNHFEEEEFLLRQQIRNSSSKIDDTDITDVLSDHSAIRNKVQVMESFLKEVSLSEVAEEWLVFNMYELIGLLEDHGRSSGRLIISNIEEMEA